MKRLDWEQWITTGAWRHTDGAALPVAPGVLGEALQIAGEDDPDARRLTALVRRDQVLTARVLRLANSAAAGAAREITRVDEAVVRLGTTSVRRLVLSLCLASWTTPEDEQALPGVDVMRHAIGAGCMARFAAPLVDADPEECFVGGLLHDLGKLALVRLRALFVRRGGIGPSRADFADSLAAHHADAGALLLQLWGVPERLRAGVRWHHVPADAADPHLASIIWLANRLCHRYGLGCAASPDDDLLEDPLALTVGVTPAWLVTIDARVASVMEDALAHVAA
ncbi:MAG: HDOD domain-containing protein [Vicinamibacterales bacterium]